jgi:hypothetical protein
MRLSGRFLFLPINAPISLRGACRHASADFHTQRQAGGAGVEGKADISAMPSISPRGAGVCCACRGAIKGTRR